MRCKYMWNMKVNTMKHMSFFNPSLTFFKKAGSKQFSFTLQGWQFEGQSHLNSTKKMKTNHNLN